MAEELTIYEKALLDLAENDGLESLSIREMKEVASFVSELFGVAKNKTLADCSAESLLDELAKRDKVVRVDDISPNHFASMDFTNMNHEKVNISGLVAQDVIFYLKEE